MVKNSLSAESMRHSFAHLLAAAVQKLYPGVQFGIGPVIENGFYYDFDGVKISNTDLPRIEDEMRRIARESHAFKKELWPAAKAKAHFKKLKQPYKMELIDDLKKTEKDPTRVGMVYMGTAFLDLCRGGHVQNTKELPADAFKLTRVAGAYWRGDEKRPMLTRVYGVAFASKKELEEYLHTQKEAEKRDHKKLGKELGLFVLSDLVGAGLPLFTPKGTVIFRELQKFSERLKREAGFQEVHIPHLAKIDLYKTSGHAEKFKDDIFYVRGKENEFVLKPMNCPHHIQIYASQAHSYRDLPVRFFETTAVYRDEQAGELGGLVRVRSITQDDAHIFAREDQIEQEFNMIVKCIGKVVRAFDIKEYSIRLSLRDEKNKKAYLGTDALWRKAQQTMERILKDNNVAYSKVPGEAAFYGPKMDFIINDSLGRQWQLATIQLDLNLPERFDLQYADADGKTKRPVMIHSAFLGAIERFMGVIIEHYAGALPFWLAPEQLWLVPVSEKFNEYARNVAMQLRADMPDIRLVIREENETLGRKIREGQLQKVPYLLIVGEREQQSSNISVRSREKGDAGTMSLQKFTEILRAELER